MELPALIVGRHKEVLSDDATSNLSIFLCIVK